MASGGLDRWMAGAEVKGRGESEAGDEEGDFVPEEEEADDETTLDAEVGGGGARGVVMFCLP